MKGKESIKPVVVFSGVNLIEGGPLSVFKDAIDAFIKNQLKTHGLVAFVNNLNLFKEYADKEIVFIERRSIKNSYVKRLWFEYIQCYYLSKKIKPFLWFALHDITPNVISVKKAVYCHNPAPFYKSSFREACLEPTFFLFSLFYKFLYRINIKSNDYIVVQQSWIREFFIKEFKVKNVIVAHPNISVSVSNNVASKENKTKFSFFYPAFPRVFKNFETLLEAAQILSRTRNDFEVVITIKGNENKYAKNIYKKFGNLSLVKFIGVQPRQKVLELYNLTDCLIFPSKLETWGLPISEMKFFEKPILIADELYAKETVNNYSKVQFFNPVEPLQLSSFMNDLIDGSIKFANNDYRKPDEPFSENWEDLLNILLA